MKTQLNKWESNMIRHVLKNNFGLKESLTHKDKVIKNEAINTLAKSLCFNVSFIKSNLTQIVNIN